MLSKSKITMTECKAWFWWSKWSFKTHLWTFFYLCQGKLSRKCDREHAGGSYGECKWLCSIGDHQSTVSKFGDYSSDSTLWKLKNIKIHKTTIAL